jgi:hypothetical protein
MQVVFVAEESSKLLSREFMAHIAAVTQDFILITVIILLLKAAQLLTESIGLPPAVQNVVDMVDMCSNIALLTLMSVSLVLRFYRRMMVES